MPLFRRIPKRGFNNKNFKTFFTIVNVGTLEGAFQDGALVDLRAVLATGLVSKEKHTEKFKVLGDGELKKKLKIRADAVSAAARKKIESAGGSVELIPTVVYREKFTRKPSTTRPHPRVHAQKDALAKARAASGGTAKGPAKK